MTPPPDPSIAPLDPVIWEPHIALAMICVAVALVMALFLWAVMWEVK